MQLKNKILFLAFLIFTLAGCAANPAAEEETLRVSGASSLSGVMDELIVEFEKDNPDIEIVANYGSSSKLRNQIENGAPADLFLSASDSDMEILVDNGLVNEESVSPFAGNGMVVATSSEIGEGTDVQAVLTSVESTLAIADPASVPLGGYTQQALKVMGIWTSLEGKMIYAKDARQVVTYLESGNAQAGIIYASDADLSEKVAEMSKIAIESEEIIYPAAIIADSHQQQIAEKFMSYILSEEGQEVIEKFGFLPLEGMQP
ncbi:molybdate ABC transporter substrate-binding protein [Planococcus sp. ISL-109]|uniref:molybdate ABC transporter substrate-binding protein n=1 Tax=Planococcus sp. ISL-109 TaxID=2819166 RepID=UPI001BE5D614|nr:molybdate ABC transporter substrate-binding protein [Planococcus sp. ISL-109]MBT2582878.1 molybdate ABC transporter substrate-binding protein [Planococcus sp. ISL-109]